VKKKRFTEERIIAALTKHEASPKVAALPRLGIADKTLYLWKSICGDMDASNAKRMRNWKSKRDSM
jgi:hypothetical protein